MVRGGRRERGSGWGTHVYLWWIHVDPECALSDGAQSLKPEKFKTLVDKARKVALAIGREI